MRFPAFLVALNQVRLVRGPVQRPFSTFTQLLNKNANNEPNQKPKKPEGPDPNRGGLQPHVEPSAGMTKKDPLSSFFLRFAGPPFNFVHNPTVVYTDEFKRLRQLLRGEFRQEYGEEKLNKLYSRYTSAVNEVFTQNLDKLASQYETDGLAEDVPDAKEAAKTTEGAGKKGPGDKESKKGDSENRRSEGKESQQKRDAAELRRLQTMCTMLEIDTLPATVYECRTKIRAVNVNMVDFSQALYEAVIVSNYGVVTRDGVVMVEENVMDRIRRVRRYKTVRQLALYCEDTGKFYPAERAKRHSLMKALLRHVSEHL